MNAALVVIGATIGGALALVFPDAIVPMLIVAVVGFVVTKTREARRRRFG